jgi:hypothetical protein
LAQRRILFENDRDLRQFESRDVPYPLPRLGDDEKPACSGRTSRANDELQRRVLKRREKKSIQVIVVARVTIYEHYRLGARDEIRKSPEEFTHYEA